MSHFNCWEDPRSTANPSKPSTIYKTCPEGSTTPFSKHALATTSAAAATTSVLLLLLLLSLKDTAGRQPARHRKETKNLRTTLD